MIIVIENKVTSWEKGVDWWSKEPSLEAREDGSRAPALDFGSTQPRLSALLHSLCCNSGKQQWIQLHPTDN